MGCSRALPSPGRRRTFEQGETLQSKAADGARSKPQSQQKSTSVEVCKLDKCMFKVLPVSSSTPTTIAVLADCRCAAIFRQRKIHSSVATILTNTRISNTTNQKAQGQMKTVVLL